MLIFSQNRESKKNAIKICEQVGIPVSTAYRVIKTYEETNSITRKKGSGRKSQKMSIKKNTLKKKSKKKKNGISCIKLASNFNISKSYAHKIIKEVGLKFYKRQRAPKVSNSQEKTIKTRIRKLYKKLTSDRENFDIIMDDESYFSLSNSKMPGNAEFYTSNIPKTPENVKLKKIEKFLARIMVWVAKSSRGISHPYYHFSRDAVNAEVYEKKFSQVSFTIHQKISLKCKFCILA